MAKKRTVNEESAFNYNDEYDYDIDDSRKKEKKAEYKKTERTEERFEEYTPKEDRKKPEKKHEKSALVPVMSVALAVVGLFILLCLIFKSFNVVGFLGKYLGSYLLGALGIPAFFIPLFMIRGAVKFKEDHEKGVAVSKLVYTIIVILFLSVVWHTFVCLVKPDVVLCKGDDTFFNNDKRFLENLAAMFYQGTEFHGGGLFGGFISIAMVHAVGYAGTMIFSVLIIAIFTIFVMGATPGEIWERFKFYVIRSSEKRAERKSRPKKEKVKKEKVQYGQPVYTKSQSDGTVVSVYGTKRSPENPYGVYGMSDSERKKKNIDNFDESTELVPYKEEKKKVELTDVFDQPEDERVRSNFADAYEDYADEPVDNEATLELEIVNDDTQETEVEEPKHAAAPTRSVVVSEPKAPVKKPAPKAPKYIFPPIDLLQPNPGTTGDVMGQELRENAEKITQTLESFNIHARVVNISKGPAVTRYEIAPETGTKVSAIMRCSEDLSLSLASVVLVEGVIPGKSAVGIQVPNKITSMVYLRELVEDPEFKASKSKLTAALGIDITGSKIFCDIAKMPHLLIAGATGTGKSVCMNSLIASLLYKSRPDEIKFIFIDPKKVEFSIYEGLPHLLVPVVSDPKKAAGALNWCVTEMERRYGILETSKKRNINEYYEYCAEHPDAEKLPQIVIIIDELADLMLSARDTVETSINRIAAKARAAGMHLIIGTQRPSVDVVTGTIKSNIPSRIACAVKAQVDSRTILDTIGAEKLVGKGDMLYAPVGSRSAYRVQGAFVGDKEIDSIVQFIKDNNGEGAYDRDIADQIEREAELCARGGKGQQSSGSEGGGDDGEGGEDPMFEQAVKVAVDEKKVSTSLLQRRLSLGYGRAAKLIDLMEERGIVSAPNGQKPREVLISYEDYLERFMHSDS